MSVLILVLMGAIYYRYQKELMLSTHRLSMQLQSESYIPRLKKWIEEGRSRTFPIDLAYATALYGTDSRSIATTLLQAPSVIRQGIRKEGRMIHFVIPLASYGIYGKYLVFETEDDGLWLKAFLQNSLLFGSAIFLLLIAVGFFLSKLFIRPMKEAVQLLDNFIKDTTHELNTPVSIIVNNIEMIDLDSLKESERKKIKRISIAAGTISSIYDDLTYLVLNHDIAVNIETLDFSELIKERMEYFKERCEQKKLSVTGRIDSRVSIDMDKRSAIRLVDNLLSNAIKYNRMGGSIEVVLQNGLFSVGDSGIGIDRDKIDRIFERYLRLDESVGGFGIGLNIVAKIAAEYGFEIEVDSAPRKGTKITVLWS